MRYFKLASLTAATLALGLMASSPLFAQATQPATGAKSAPPPADSKMAPAAKSDKMAPAAKADTKTDAKPAAKTEAKSDLIDLNSASAAELEALKGIGWEVRVFQYEVWGLCIPNLIVVIDDVMDAKIEMLNQFRFANSALDYTHSTKGLNMFHSRMLGAGLCRYAERFFELPKMEYVDLVSRVEAASAANRAAA